MPDRTEYNRSYYERNREKILQRKRERYANDDAYREKVKQSSASRRKPEKQKKTPMRIEVGGFTAYVYTVRLLAERVGKSVSAVNYWQKTGTLPETPFVNGQGHRLYTDGMIATVEEAVIRWPRPPAGDEVFRKFVLDGWSKLGVFAAVGGAG